MLSPLLETLLPHSGLLSRSDAISFVPQNYEMTQKDLTKFARLCGCAFLAMCVACGGGPPSDSTGGGGGSTGGDTTAPAYFGMQQSHIVGCDSTQPYPIFDGPVGSYRAFGGSCAAFWVGMDNGPSASPQYDFSGIDTLLSTLRARGINEVLLTLGRTPNYISSNPTDLECDGSDTGSAGQCDPPSDVDAIRGSGLGDGSDASWRNYVTALLQHVTASGYASSHAHIAFYEIWNEFHRSDTLSQGAVTCAVPPNGIACSYRGTFAQMLRMTQDLRCIVEGNASDPITALGTTCGSGGFTATGLDTTATVAEGNAGGSAFDAGNSVMANYLSYANGAGAAATDFIDGHSYFSNGAEPEGLMQYVAAEEQLAPSKPYYVSEGSWGKNETQPDPSLQAAYLPRWYLMLDILYVQRAYWFAWDEAVSAGNGSLWSASALTAPPLQCQTADNGGDLCTGGVAYDQSVGWLSGATLGAVTCPSRCTNPSSGVFVVNLTRSGGYEAQILWDSTPVSGCSNPQCGSTPIGAGPSFTVLQWRDVTGTTHSGAPTTVGASPIILENMAPPSS